MFNFRSIIAAGALALAVAGPAAADTTLLQVPWTGSPNGSVWALPWTNAQNTNATSPLRWTPGSADVWYTVFFEGRTDSYAGATAPGLAAALTFQLDSVTNDGKTFTFDYEIWNASNATGANVITSSRVTSFSFDVDPDETAAALAQGGGWTPILIRDKAMQAGATTLNSSTQDICIKVGQANNCHGGQGNAGVAAGMFGTGSFSLTFLTAPAQLVFTDPMVRYQAINIEGGANGASGTGVPVAYVPEPGAWALMILGFGAVGATLRARRRVAA